ncbi:MAG: hypothetical protein ACJAYR_003494, partial [Sneathiella sp.]
AITKDDLDAHFDKKVIEFVEEANEYFKKEVLSLIQ